MNEEKQCSQHGYSKEHPLVTSFGLYSAWKWLALLTGVSVKPQKVMYRCTVCEEIFDETTDEEVLNYYYL